MSSDLDSEDTSISIYENMDEEDLDRELEELNDSDDNAEARFSSTEEMMDYVGEYLNESIEGAVPYQYLPTHKRKYEPLLGFKPVELKGRVDKENDEENNQLLDYRKSAVHQAYKKIRKDAKKLVSIY